MTQSAVNQAPLIAHVVYSFSVGGLENGVVNLINRMPVQDWRHAVVALTDVSEEFRGRVQRPDVEYVALKKPPGHLLPMYPRLVSLFRSMRPAIVHTRNLAALEATVPAWMAGVPVRIHGEHGRDVSDPDGSNRRYQLVRRVYRPFVHRYIALSQDLERYLENKVGVPPDCVSQIYNGVDTDRFKPATAGRTPIPGSPFVDPNLWLVGTVGRMQAVKDQLNLARAFVRALEIQPAAAARMRLVMVGDGPIREQAAELLRSARRSDLAWFAGERDDVPEILRGLDCFVLPSLAEGISNTILESMASGLPIVATRVGGNPELIEDGLTGRIVPAQNSNAMAEAMLAYFNDPFTARRHAKAARHAAVKRFSLDRMVSDYVSVYRSALGMAGAPRGVLKASS